MRESAIAVSVLAVLPSQGDCDTLHAIFTHSNWELDLVRTLEEAKVALRNGPLGVIISDCHLPDGNCWKNLLNEVGSMQHPPLLIVTDRRADDRLWAVVLNLGAYDLIMKPFDPQEVFRTVSLAWRRWKNQSEDTARKPPGSVGDECLPAGKSRIVDAGG